MKCLLLLLWLTLAVTGRAAAAPPPNLIIILADDLGYSDPGCFGGEIATPHLDRLAKEGTRLTHFHNGGMCVVSRAMMMTGQWWPRAVPQFSRMPLLPEKLRTAGYRNALIGKWHLDGHPLDRGFDHFFGFLAGFADHFKGAASWQLDRKPFRDYGPDFYSSDAFTDRAIAFVRRPAPEAAARPFFLYLSYQAPHNPLQALRADILRHRGQYLGGWQATREARFRRQQDMGLVPANTTLPAYPENLPDWKSLTPAQRDLEDLRMAVHAAMVERMDAGIGRLMAALQESGQAANTFILFLSDNGADPFSVVDDAMLKQGKLPGDRDSNWQLGQGWACASVTPWRLCKISQHGGGVTTGAIAWGVGVGGAAGRVEASPLHMIDVLPTFLDLAGSPGVAAETAGESFSKLLRGEPWRRKSPLFFQYMDNRALRTADWTLAEVDGGGWELFNALEDPLETTNVLKAHPDIAAGLQARWEGWWRTESGQPVYQAQTTKGSPHYHPQGDRGTGQRYQPRAMPAALAGRYPLP